MAPVVPQARQKGTYCEVCLRRFPKGSNPKKQVYSITKEMLYLCDECGYEKSNTQEKEKNLKCGVCSERFSERWDLNVHLRTQHFVQVKNLTYFGGSLKTFAEEE